MAVAIPRLPHELLEDIFLRLSPTNLLRVCTSAKCIRQVGNKQMVWTCVLSGYKDVLEAMRVHNRTEGPETTDGLKGIQPCKLMKRYIQYCKALKNQTQGHYSIHHLSTSWMKSLEGSVCNGTYLAFKTTEGDREYLNIYSIHHDFSLVKRINLSELCPDCPHSRFSDSVHCYMQEDHLVIICRHINIIIYKIDYQNQLLSKTKRWQGTEIHQICNASDEFLVYLIHGVILQVIDLHRGEQNTLITTGSMPPGDSAVLHIVGHLLYMTIQEEDVKAIKAFNLRTREELFSTNYHESTNVKVAFAPSRDNDLLYFRCCPSVDPDESDDDWEYGPSVTLDGNEVKDINRFTGADLPSPIKTTNSQCCAINYKNGIFVFSESDKCIEAYSPAGEELYALNDVNKVTAGDTTREEESVPTYTDDAVDVRVTGNILMTVSKAAVVCVYNINTGKLLYTVPLLTVPSADNHLIKILYLSPYKAIIDTKTSLYALNFT